MKNVGAGFLWDLRGNALKMGRGDKIYYCEKNECYDLAERWSYIHHIPEMIETFYFKYI